MHHRLRDTRLVVVKTASIRLGLCVLLCSSCISDTPLQPERPATSKGRLGPAAAIEARALRNQPGIEHERLSVLVGDWSVKVQAFDPSGEQPPRVIASGETHIRWDFGGRFLRLNSQLRVDPGDTSSQRESTRVRRAEGLLGYDRNNREYQFLWVSAQSTELGLARGDGRLQRDGIIFRARAGQGESHMRLAPNGRLLVERYVPGPGGKRRLHLRTIYKRVSGAAPDRAPREHGEDVSDQHDQRP